MSGLSFSQAARLVAQREVVQRGKDKSFLISLGITLAIVLAIIGINKVASGADSYDVGVVQGSGVPVAAVQAVGRASGVELHVSDVSAEQATARVRSGDLDAALTAPGTVLVHKKLSGTLRPLLEQANTQAVGASRLRDKGIDPAQVSSAFDVPALSVRAQDPVDKNADERTKVATVGTFLLYGQLIGYAMWVALGIVEEKSSRVVELLLSTVSARALLAGKVVGIGLLGLVQLLLIAAVGLGAALATGTVEGTSNAIVPIAMVLGWFLLGYAFYSVAYAAAAARVSRQEDLQNVTTPMTLVIVASFFGALWAGSHADSPVARVLGVVPPFSALVNPQRVSSGDAAGWETPLAVVLMLAVIAGLVVVAARLYEGAVLHSGSVVSWRTAWGGRTPAAASRES
ncbi:ABC-2 type transport system permease protein [Motilibacter peucedani]|uniref:ABC-2 type transport system permease protein n=1 Tax=Motilibacter peucedani TaxID=598650 RepID=A0A420XTB5_9ACTN|nr:ABC transporter permease [Motilibacter peucedani]RKS80102.1 ABC-2 type transport system permease protein [Motilibacter peucedani]